MVIEQASLLKIKAALQIIELSALGQREMTDAEKPIIATFMRQLIDSLPATTEEATANE